MINIIIYGTGLLGKKLMKQIECYNRIVQENNTGEGIKVLAFTQTVCKGGYVGEIPIISLDECQSFSYDYVVIASSYAEEIESTIKNKKIFDLQKVVRKNKFYPQNNGLNISQINSNYFYKKELESQHNPELERLFKAFENQNNFIDILNRRRFIEDKEEIEKYRKTEIFYDSDEMLKYVLVDGKRLYYPGTWSDKKIKEYHALNMYTCLSKMSAHRYLDPYFNAGENDIVADIGAAEGFFSLNIIDKVKKVYLFETDMIWIKPLLATFRSYKEKIEIVNKFVSNINQWEFVTCDSYFDNKEITLIKMDIEGEEQKALLGCRNILKRNNLRWLIACYHRSEDMEFIDAFMKVNGYITEKVENWLWLDQSNLDIKLFGEFRKAMLRARKN